MRNARELIMATIRDILAVKGSQVLSIDPAATAHDAAVRMHEHKVGSLLVMSGGTLVGIVTERDIMHRVVVPKREPTETQVCEIMTAELVCCRRETSLEEARGVMKNRRLRHLPVLDDVDQLCGMVSIGDLNAHEVLHQELTIHVLREYISGRT
jgi:CBS domain-containing protein